MMAIRILLDHDVPEQNIMLLSLLMAQSGQSALYHFIDFKASIMEITFFSIKGVHSIAYAFPRVKIVTTAIDPEINSSFHVIPGIGNFGDRYFGTEPCTDDEYID